MRCPRLVLVHFDSLRVHVALPRVRARPLAMPVACDELFVHVARLLRVDESRDRRTVTSVAVPRMVPFGGAAITKLVTAAMTLEEQHLVVHGW